MGPLSLILMLSVGFLATALGGDDDDVAQEDDLPEEEDAPDEEPPLDTGATFDITDNTVTIELGADETGSLAVFTYVDTEDNVEGFVETYEARYYLVPEGVDLNTTDYETRSEIPGFDTFEGNVYDYDLAAMEEHLGLEFLGTVDLGVENARGFDDMQGHVDEHHPASVTNNIPIDVFYLAANTDGDELIHFLPDDFVVTYNGDVEQYVTTDATGTDGDDWIVANAEGITIHGGEGDDTLELIRSNVTLIGGAGDDSIAADSGKDAAAFGGLGNDTISIDSGIALGGLGDDHLDSYGNYAVTLDGGVGDDFIGADGDNAMVFGGEGNDSVYASGPSGLAFGGAGDDFVGARNGGSGFGGEGNDHLQVDAGSSVDGGAGDDLIQVWNQFRNDAGPATVTGGEGNDTIDIGVWNPVNGAVDEIYAHITDFDPAEDVLEVGLFQTWGIAVADVEVIEAADGSYSDVRITYTSLAGQPPGIAVVRLDGTTGVTADQIVIVN